MKEVLAILILQLGRNNVTEEEVFQYLINRINELTQRIEKLEEFNKLNRPAMDAAWMNVPIGACIQESIKKS